MPIERPSSPRSLERPRPRGITRTLLAAALLMLGCRRTPQPPAGSADVRLEDHTVVYKGARLTLGTALADWTRVLGATTRYVDRAGGIYVWDELGFAVSLRTTFGVDAPHVAAFRIFFTHRDVDFWPRKPYRGTVAVAHQGEGPGDRDLVLTLDAQTSLGSLMRQKVPEGNGAHSLWNTVVLRYTPGTHDEGLELCSLESNDRAVRLPWEPVLEAGLPGPAEPAPEPGPALGASDHFELRGNVLTFNGHPLRFGDRMESWTRALGAPDGPRSGIIKPGIRVGGLSTVDGRHYASVLTVKFGQAAFPGSFVLQGVRLSANGPPLRQVQEALGGTETPLLGLGRGRLPESAKMHVHRPDGFDVVVATHLDCPHRPLPSSPCVQVIDELEIDATW